MLLIFKKKVRAEKNPKLGSVYKEQLMNFEIGYRAPKFWVLTTKRDKAAKRKDRRNERTVFIRKIRFKKFFNKRRIFRVNRNRIDIRLRYLHLKNYSKISKLIIRIINYFNVLKEFNHNELEDLVIDLERDRLQKKIILDTQAVFGDFLKDNDADGDSDGLLKIKKRLLKRFFKRTSKIRRRLKRSIKKKKMCSIILKQTDTNFFIIATDLLGKVIGYVTAGQISYSNNVKRKLSYFLVFPMMYQLVNKLKNLHIKYINLHIRNYISPHVNKVQQFLRRKRFIINKMFYSKRVPHHIGQRKRKLKRK